MTQVNREHRDVLAECIRQFLEGKLRSSELHDGIALVNDSADPTVKYIVGSWFEFDDIDIEPVSQLDKSDWDLFQRWLLVLDSDRHVLEETKAHWNLWQLAAALGSLVLLICVWKIGFWTSLIWLSIPFGLISLWIYRSSQPSMAPYAEVIAPFESFTSLRQTYDEVPTFSKMRYPGSRKTRHYSRWLSFATSPHSAFFWLVVLPTCFLLPFQILPRVETKTRVILNLQTN